MGELDLSSAFHSQGNFDYAQQTHRGRNDELRGWFWVIGGATNTNTEPTSPDPLTHGRGLPSSKETPTIRVLVPVAFRELSDGRDAD